MIKETTMTRRSAMLAIPVVGATVLSFPTSSEAASTARQVIDLIEAHRRAFVVFEDMCDAEQAATDAYKIPFTLVPTFIGLDGKPRRFWEFSAHPDATEEEIEKSHGEMRDRYCGKGAAVVHTKPEIAAASWAITVSLRRCLRAYRNAVAEELRHREATGYAQVMRDYETASDAEREALIALCGAPCRSPEESAAKAAYLASLLRRHVLGDDHFEALVTSLMAA